MWTANQTKIQTKKQIAIQKKPMSKDALETNGWRQTQATQYNMTMGIRKTQKWSVMLILMTTVQKRKNLNRKFVIRCNKNKMDSLRSRQARQCRI